MTEQLPTPTPAKKRKTTTTKTKSLYKRDVQAVIKEINFGPDHRTLSAVHGISDAAYCVNRAKEVLITQQTGGSKSEKRDQIIMATRLLMLALILDPVKV